MALKFLVHLVGDIHQPLHVGRREDRGGNLIQVQWFGEPSNLHKVWDEQLIEAEKLSFSEFAAFLTPPTAAEVEAWQQATDPRLGTRGHASAAPGVCHWRWTVGLRLYLKQMPTVKARLLRAGVRLAGLLNTIFAAP